PSWPLSSNNIPARPQNARRPLTGPYRYGAARFLNQRFAPVHRTIRNPRTDNDLVVQVKPGIMAEEGVNVGRFLDDLASRLARSVPRAGFDPDQMWSAVRVGALQRRKIFEAVPRDHAVVGIRGRHQHRRVMHAGLDVMV